MRRLLVSGGAGFIGANFVHYWRRRHPGDRIVVIDALTYAGNLSSLAAHANSPAFSFVRGDICDGELVARTLRDERIDTIVHFAAESHVDRSIEGPDAFVQTNIVGTQRLLDAARSLWGSPGASQLQYRFHHISTDEVYGSLGHDDPAFSENTPYAPNSPYAASKAASDHLVRAYHHTYGLPVTTSNCSNNYGPYQFPEKLIPLLIVNILQGKPLPVYGDGLNIRDWLHVDDHVRGIELILEKGRVGETYNIGANSEQTNIDVVTRVCRLLDEMFAADPSLGQRFENAPPARAMASEELITKVTDRPGHDRRYAIDGTKIASELGFCPAESFDSGLGKTIRWYLDNEAWWQAVMDQRYRKWIDLQYGSTDSTGAPRLV